ncbi:MAG: 16S rRNA (guanine(527)-N(7))-methyltransferase RsmG [Firmicutes bacterium]|nr:16S rRNA (guanine(527)-N(7))-methyltransferase RsmG [Bacillota bacterium]
MEFDASIFQSTLRQGLSEWDLSHLEDRIPQMQDFAELIIETNKTLNLTRIVESEEMAIKNFLDSLSCLNLAWPEKMRVLDLGTGAGFPGIPLAIAQPGWSIVLLDSLKKRLKFLDDAIEKLSMTNVSTFHARGEDAGQAPEHRETYDLVVSRAVASLPVLLELCIPLVRVGGHFIAYKSTEAGVELEKSSKAMKELHVQKEQVFSLQLPLDMGERNLLVFKKLGPTPPVYPRRAGVPSKHPLE